MGLFNRKTKRQNPDDAFEIMGGLFQDKERRTREGFRYLGLSLLFAFIFVLGIVLFFISKHEYKQWTMNNTTAPGTQLLYSRSQAPVTIASVWTDKNRDVTVVEFKYDDIAKNLLSTKGTNYNLYVATDKDDPKPDIEEMKYGILGTEGNGYLFIKGHLKPRAYQIYIANTVELASESEGTPSSSTMDVDESIDKTISDVSLADIDENGIAKRSYKPDEERPKVDNINFRINNYSENTKVYKGSFLDENGDIDYSAIISNTNIKALVDYTNKMIAKSENQLSVLEASLKEYEDRLAQNSKDMQAQENIASTKEAIENEKSNLRNLEKTKARYVTADFDKSSFGKMQEKFKIQRIDE